MKNNYYVDGNYDEKDIIEKVQNMIANGFYLDGKYVDSFDINIQINAVNNTTIISTEFFEVEIVGILSKDAIGEILPFIFNDGNAIEKANIYDEPYYTNLNRNEWISKFQFIFKNNSFKLHEKDIFSNEIVMNIQIINKTPNEAKRLNRYYYLTIIDKYYDKFKSIENELLPIVLSFKPIFSVSLERLENKKELVKRK